MDRRQELEDLSHKDLLKQARSYGLKPPRNRNRCIDMIVTHMESQDHLDVSARSFTSQNGAKHAGCKRRDPVDVHEEHTPSEVETLKQLCVATKKMDKQDLVIEKLVSALSSVSASGAMTSSQTATDNARLPDPGGPHSSFHQIPTHTHEYYHPLGGSANFSQYAQANSGHAIKFLSSQIPSFAGSEDENVEIWIGKIESTAILHGLSQIAMLAAATSKLEKNARRWFDMQSGAVNRSWDDFKYTITRRYRRKILFSTVMQKADARKWVFSKENFQDYAGLDKLAIIQCLRLPDEDVIQCLINGINHTSIRATAASLPTLSVDDFVMQMHHITSSCDNLLRKSATPYQEFKKKGICETSPNPEHQAGELQARNSDSFCVYCRQKGYTRDNCDKLKKKDFSKKSVAGSSPPVAAVQEDFQLAANIAAVPSPVIPAAKDIALVDNPSPKEIITSSTLLKITSLNDIDCKLSALLDTGSGISFIDANTFKNFFNIPDQFLSKSKHSYNAINGQSITIRGSFIANIILEELPAFKASITLHVLSNNLSAANLIIGRDFLEEHEINILFCSSRKDIIDKIKLFAEIASTDIIENSPNSSNFADLISNISTDTNTSPKNQLISLLQEIHNADIPSAKDDYYVKFTLKDDKEFAYAPRRLAFSERTQVRNITNNLLERGIIKASTSPYCSPIVPIRKKDGSLRLCVDLRTLNNKVVKQRYPFPVIEDYLSRLSN